MFHSYALVFNSVLLFVCVCSYHWSIISQLQIKLSGLLLILSVVVLFIFVSFLFVFISSLITDVKVGNPPLGSLVIAYKYGLSSSLTRSIVYSIYELFETNDKVQICYERRSGSFGIAYGAVIHDKIDEINEETKTQLVHNGFSILQTKHISNAMYIQCPALPWLSYLGLWLTLRIVYPKIYRYSKKQRLSAYPVIEIYRRFSVILMAPLSQQDYFVVPEAEPSLHRSSNLNISFNSSNISYSTYHSRSHSTGSCKFSEVDNNNITKISIHSSTPKPLNGNAKHG